MNEEEKTTEETTEQTTEIPAKIPAEDPAKVPASTPAETAAGSAKPAAPANPLAEIGAAYVEEWPEAQPHFVEQVKSEAAETEQAETLAENGGDFRFLKDSNGHYWNPAICSAKIDPKTKQPEKTARGYWVLLKGKKRKDLKKTPPKGSAAEVPGAAADIAAEQAAAIEKERQRLLTAKGNAEVIDGVAWMISQGIWEEYGKPEPGESEAGKMWLEKHFLSMEEMPEFKPWVMVAFVYGKAMATRAMNKEARKKASGWKTRFQFLAWKLSGGRWATKPGEGEK